MIKSDWKIISICILGIMLIIVVGNTAYNNYNENINNKLITAQQYAYTLGENNIIVNIMNTAVTCQEVTLSYDNVSINMIAVGCLQSTPVETND